MASILLRVKFLGAAQYSSNRGSLAVGAARAEGREARKVARIVVNCIVARWWSVLRLIVASVAEATDVCERKRKEKRPMLLNDDDDIANLL